MVGRSIIARLHDARVILALMAFLAAASVILCAGETTMYWVGHVDLAVEFVVTDAKTGAPIAGAEIEIDSEGGLFDNDRTGRFQLTTNPAGIARETCFGSLCFGAKSWRRDTFHVHLPWWQFRVRAAGYGVTNWIYLDQPAYRIQARRDGRNAARVTARIAMHPS